MEGFQFSFSISPIDQRIFNNYKDFETTKLLIIHLLLQAASETSNKSEFLERARHAFHLLKERIKSKHIKPKKLKHLCKELQRCYLSLQYLQKNSVIKRENVKRRYFSVNLENFVGEVLVQAGISEVILNKEISTYITLKDGYVCFCLLKQLDFELREYYVILKDDLWRLRKKRMDAERNNKEIETNDQDNLKKPLLRRLFDFLSKKKD